LKVEAAAAFSLSTFMLLLDKLKSVWPVKSIAATKSFGDLPI